MRKAVAILLLILVVSVCAVSIAYGASPDVRVAMNGFFLDFLGPTLYNGWVGFVGVVHSNPYYMMIYPLLWMTAGILIAGSVHTLISKGKQKLGMSTTTSPTKSITFQREPAEPEPPQKTEEPIKPEQ